MERVPVISKDNTPLMPTKPSRARRWIKQGKAEGKFNDLGQFYIQLKEESSGEITQSISVGLDPGKLYSGIGVQSSLFTLWTAHLELPFKRVRERMDNRRFMRRGRRGRRINRKLPFSQRCHRQKRFSNRRKSKLAPSIKANRQLEIRVICELAKIYPISNIIFEYVKADIDLTSGRKKAKSGKGFSVVMIGQKWAIQELSKIAPVEIRYGWQTSNLRKYLGLEKSNDKSDQVPNSHAVDGVVLACYNFIDYQSFIKNKERGHNWIGKVKVTSAPFTVIKRPPVSRRQLHLMVPAKGNIRRKYGGTTTRFNLRKGDFVKAEKLGQIFTGWVSGDTKTQISVSDFNWKRIAQFTSSKVNLISRSTGLICKPYYGELTLLSSV